MNLSKNQINIISRIETLLSIKLSATALKRNVVLIDNIDKCGASESQFYTKIENICNKYFLGKVEPNGIDKIAIILMK